jgi:hypothetical protein
MDGTILYSTATIAAKAAAGARLRREVQSAAAEDLVSRIGSGVTVTARSKSHSRTMIAVAVGDAPGLRLGIDVEWKKPDRPFEAIAGLYLDVAGASIGADAFYRAWTFGEAYFKAFQKDPGPSALRQILARSSADPVRLGADGPWVYQRPLGDDYQMTLVWQTRNNGSCRVSNVTLG